MMTYEIYTASEFMMLLESRSYFSEELGNYSDKDYAPLLEDESFEHFKVYKTDDFFQFLEYCDIHSVDEDLFNKLFLLNIGDNLFYFSLKFHLEYKSNWRNNSTQHQCEYNFWYCHFLHRFIDNILGESN